MISIQERALRFFKDQALASAWLDTPFRSLQGRTPRQCSQTEDGQQKALALLEAVLVEDKKSAASKEVHDH